jgi:hypothetical protein
MTLVCSSDLCVTFKKVFWVEQKLYSKDELKLHMVVGDLDDTMVFKGHPECIFCKNRYFGKDELYEHCRERHDVCFLCERNRIYNIYYRDYFHLVSLVYRIHIIWIIDGLSHVISLD